MCNITMCVYVGLCVCLSMHHFQVDDTIRHVNVKVEYNIILLLLIIFTRYYIINNNNIQSIKFYYCITIVMKY